MLLLIRTRLAKVHAHSQVQHIASTFTFVIEMPNIEYIRQQAGVEYSERVHTNVRWLVGRNSIG